MAEIKYRFRELSFPLQLAVVTILIQFGIYVLYLLLITSGIWWYFVN